MSYFFSAYYFYVNDLYGCTDSIHDEKTKYGILHKPSVSRHLMRYGGKNESSTDECVLIRLTVLPRHQVEIQRGRNPQ